MSGMQPMVQRSSLITGHELAVGDYCVIATLYEDGEWINTVRTCQTIEEPEPPRIQYTSIRYNDYHMVHYVDTYVVNMVFGNNYTLDVQLVNDTTDHVMISENDTINASFLNSDIIHNLLVLKLDFTVQLLSYTKMAYLSMNKLDVDTLLKEMLQ